jgi:multiple sugar transport system substrate-binding protein
MQLMKRHIIPAASILAITTIALAGCSSGGGGGGGGYSSPSSAKGGIPATTINVIAADYGNGPSAPNSGSTWWAGVIKNFNKKYPQVTVKMNVVNWTDVDNQIKSQVQAGNPPDIAQASADWAGLQGMVYPADQVLSPAVQQDLIGVFADQGKIGNTKYGIPWIASSRAMIYNKSLFQKAGISAPPTTWAEYKTDAQKLKAAGVQTPACIPLGNEEAQAETLIWELGDGGGFVNSSGDWDLNSAQNVETFTFLNSLKTAGLSNSSPATMDRTKGCWAQFDAGHVGMTNSMTAQLPGLKAAGTSYAFAPEPGKDGLAKSTVGVNDWIWAFKTKQNHQAADKAFIDFALSEQNQLSFFNLYNLLPVTTSASTAVVAQAPNLKAFTDAMATDTFYPVNKSTWPQVNAQMKQIVGQAVSSSPKHILDQLQATATKG